MCPPLHLSHDPMSHDPISYSLVRFYQAFIECKISDSFPSRNILYVANFVHKTSLYEKAQQKQTGRKFILTLLLLFLNNSIKTQYDLTKGRQVLHYVLQSLACGTLLQATICLTLFVTRSDVKNFYVERKSSSWNLQLRISLL